MERLALNKHWLMEEVAKLKVGESISFKGKSLRTLKGEILRGEWHGKITVIKDKAYGRP